MRIAHLKVRVDQLLVKRGLAPSRHQAEGLILAGKVFSRTGRVEKAGELLEEKEPLTVEEPLRFVSRGGIKLEHALMVFSVPVRGRVCLDVGASTGGFTDCLLQRGAARVYAVDVGRGQFDWRLRRDPRVVLFEKTNFRHFSRERIPDPIDLAVIDVSFISLSKILPRVLELLREGGEAIALVKPQFELGPGEAKRGVVRTAELRERAVAAVLEVAEKLGFIRLERTPSPIRGAKGNEEHFIHLLKPYSAS